MSHHECHSDSHCASDDCSTVGRHHHSHSEECCGGKDCRCHCHQKQKYRDQLLKLADYAWMELLKEEIKKEIMKNSAENLKKLAELTARVNHKRWAEKMEEKGNLESFEEELKSLLSKKK